jgi:protoporphyrinogen oxidase
MKIAVIGGGITGLTSAYFLGKVGHKVELFEAKETLGGLADSFEEENWDWRLEKYFHHYFTSDKYVKNLAVELGLEKKLFFKNVQTSVYSGGSIYPFDKPLDIIKYPGLDTFSKLRMGVIIFFLRLLPYLSFYDRFTAKGLFSILIGKNAWQKVWQPLMENKFHQYTDEVAFSWLWARLKKRSQKLGYFEGGTSVLVNKLQEGIEKKSKIHLATKITSIKKNENKWLLTSDKKEFTADKVIIAVPLSQALKLIQTWKELRDKNVSTLR